MKKGIRKEQAPIITITRAASTTTGNGVSGVALRICRMCQRVISALTVRQNISLKCFWKAAANIQKPSSRLLPAGNWLGTTRPSQTSAKYLITLLSTGQTQRTSSRPALLVESTHPIRRTNVQAQELHPQFCGLGMVAPREVPEEDQALGSHPVNGFGNCRPSRGGCAVPVRGWLGWHCRA